MQVLHNAPDAPHDLRQKALRLAGRILEFDPDVRGGDGFNIARDILDSGRALIKMQAIIHAQGTSEIEYQPGQFNHNVITTRAGVVTAINNLQMAKIARLAGAPLDKGAGVDLYKKIGDTVIKDEPLYSIYADFPTDFQFAKNLVEQDNGYTIKTSL
jgi:thymidine phosphorylase